MANWVNVAEFTKAKNLEGGLVVRATKGLPFLLAEGMDVTFVPPVLRIPRHARVTRVTQTGNGFDLVFFEGITDISTAEKLLGHYCLVRESDLPEGWDENGELDLSGFAVLDSEGALIGTVIEVEENPAHPLLVVDADGREVLIPLVEEFVCSIDEEAPAIVMSLPDGLLDL